MPSGTDASCHQNNFAHKLSFQYCFVYVRDTCFLLEGIILWWCPAKSGLSILLSFQSANINKETKTTIPISGAMLSIPAKPPQFINISPDIFHLTLFSFYSPIPFCYPFFEWRFFCYFYTFSLQTLPCWVWLMAVSIYTLLSRVFLIVHPQWNLIMLLPYVCYWQSPLQSRSCILSSSKAFAMSASTMCLLSPYSVASV